MLQPGMLQVSRPSEKFRFESSRKFLLTAVLLKDGTNRDEPGGTRLAEMVEAGQGRCRDAAAGGEDGRERPLCAKAAEAHGWRRRCSATSAEPVVEPADRRADAGVCHRIAEAVGVARLRTDVRERHSIPKDRNRTGAEMSILRTVSEVL